MAMTKTTKSKGVFGPLQTGNNHMAGPQHAGKQKPISTQPDMAAGRNDAGGGFGKGGPQTGSGHMIKGQQHAGKQVAGQSASGGLDNGGGGFGKGGPQTGNTHMFGPQGSNTAKPA